jgi:hypothetical protein
MRLWLTYLTGNCLRAWRILLGAAIIISLGFGPQTKAEEEIRSRLDRGEVIVSAREVPGSSLKHAKMTAIIKAPPEVVWQVITAVNEFRFFMPQTLKSMAVDPEKVPMIVQKQPTKAEEVEKLLGPTPADPASYRVPGGKYTIYHYSHLNFPWPCNNRWYIVKSMQDETGAAQHDYRLTWSLVIGNLKENSGEWILEPYGTNQTKAIYRLNTDPGGAIPGFLIKQGTFTTLPQIIEAVQERAVKLSKVR